MYPVLFQVSDYIIYTYGAAMVLTFFVCLPPILYFFPRNILTYSDIYNFFLIIIVILFSSQFISLLIMQSFNFTDAIAVFHLRGFGGFSSYPALIATFIAFYLYCRIYNIPYLRTLDFLFPYAILALAIQRIFGCFMASCCHGQPTELPWGVLFPDTSSAGKIFHQLAIHPTQLYYGITTFLIWVFLLTYKKRYKDSWNGEITVMGLSLLSITYFLLHFYVEI